MKTRALIQKIENEIINGAVATDANGFDGIFAQITTNTTTLSAVISIDAVRTTILYCQQGGTTYSAVYGGGSPDLIICDLATEKDLKILLDPYMRFAGPLQNIAWGFTSIEIDHIPVLASKFMDTATTVKSLAVLDTSVIRLAVALDITMEGLAKTADSDKRMIKWYGALVILNERYCGEILTIT